MRSLKNKAYSGSFSLGSHVPNQILNICVSCYSFLSPSCSTLVLLVYSLFSFHSVIVLCNSGISMGFLLIFLWEHLPHSPSLLHNVQFSSSRCVYSQVVRPTTTTVWFQRALAPRKQAPQCSRPTLPSPSPWHMRIFLPFFHFWWQLPIYFLSLDLPILHIIWIIQYVTYCVWLLFKVF